MMIVTGFNAMKMLGFPEARMLTTVPALAFFR
jgi:hypothetical protein